MDASAKDDLPAGARQQLAWSLADVYEYRVDMSRDLQDGDEFKVVAERSVAPTGAMRIGKVHRRDVQALRQHDRRRALRERIGQRRVLRSERQVDARRVPARAARVPSHLEHLRQARASDPRRLAAHKGTDYAAATGTPVRAIGDGVVAREGWGNGYGNVLEIRHRNGFVTRYGHLSRFAAASASARASTIGQTVAFVGSTGSRTGPHLHFEVLVNGEQRDPRVALKQTGGDPDPRLRARGVRAAPRPAARVARQRQ